MRMYLYLFWNYDRTIHTVFSWVRLLFEQLYPTVSPPAFFFVIILIFLTLQWESGMILSSQFDYSSQTADGLYHRLSGLNNLNLFSHSSEDWKFQNQGLSVSFLLGALILAFRGPHSHHVLTWERQRQGERNFPLFHSLFFFFFL